MDDDYADFPAQKDALEGRDCQKQATLVELPNGDWIDPLVVQGVRLMNDKQFGPRVAIDAYGTPARFFFHMDDAEAARAWVKDFCTKCNEQRREIA